MLTVLFAKIIYLHFSLLRVLAHFHHFGGIPLEEITTLQQFTDTPPYIERRKNTLKIRGLV